MIRNLENQELEYFRGLLRLAVETAQDAHQADGRTEQFIYLSMARTVLDEAMRLLGEDCPHAVIDEHLPPEADADPAIEESTEEGHELLRLTEEGHALLRLTEEGHALLRLGPGGDFIRDYTPPTRDPEADRCPTGAVAGFVVIGFFAFLMGAAVATAVLWSTPFEVGAW